MPTRLTGGCKCGLVRYSALQSDAAMFRCHCRDCQQLTGTGHSDMTPAVAGSFDASGPYRVFEMTGGSGLSTFSGFCSNCGSQLTRRSERVSACIYLYAASLDDPAIYRPEKSIYSEAAQPWDGAVIEDSEKG